MRYAEAVDRLDARCRAAAGVSDDARDDITVPSPYGTHDLTRILLGDLVDLNDIPDIQEGLDNIATFVLSALDESTDTITQAWAVRVALAQALTTGLLMQQKVGS